MKKKQNRKYLNELGTSGNCMDVAKCGRGDFVVEIVEIKKLGSIVG